MREFDSVAVISLFNEILKAPAVLSYTELTNARLPRGKRLEETRKSSRSIIELPSPSG